VSSAWGVSWGSAWGNSWGATGAVVVTTPVATQGMGPGWDFHPTFTRKRRVDDLEGEIRAALNKAEEAESPRQVKKAVQELREAAREAIAETPPADDRRFAAMVETLQQLASIQSARLYMQAVAEMMRKQDEDDFEALVLMAIAA
jgi:hypothetical protein